MSEQPAIDPELARMASVNLNLLVPLLAVLEERSVTRAAAKVGLSQPAMSHALRRMRDLLGDELIIRQGNGTVLTPRAAELVTPLRQALRQAARIVDSRPFDPATDRRVVTVAMTTSAAMVIANPLARLFAERAPNAVLNLRTLTNVSDAVFADEGADVLLQSDSFASALPRERLYDDRWVVVMGSGEPAAVSTADSSAPDSTVASTAELLTALPHVTYDGSPRLRPYEILEERKIPYRVQARVSDYLIVLHLLSGTRSVALHRFRIATALRDLLGLRIEEFPFPVEDDLGVDMIFNPWLHDDAFTTWLRQLLLDAAATLD